MFFRADKQAPDADLKLPGLVRVCDERSGISYLTDENLKEANSIVVAFSERSGGFSTGKYSSLNLGDAVGDDPEAVYQNRYALLKVLGLKAYAGAFVNPRQIHSTNIFTVSSPKDDLGPCLSGCDGVVALVPAIPVMLCFADCVPVVLVEPKGSVAVLHAGWRGALGGIVSKGCEILYSQTGQPPSRLNAYIGPHIKSCCYETSHDILAQFIERFGPACDAGNNRLALEEAVKADMLAAGIDERRICSAGVCTCCSHDRFFSYRASLGDCGRHCAIACAL